MAGKLRVEVVTAERLVYEVDDADMVLAPGQRGCSAFSHVMRRLSRSSVWARCVSSGGGKKTA